MLVSSFPYAIPWTQANIPAILQSAHTSQDEGTAIADVLFGDYNPGGHLNQTWPKSLEQLPPMDDYDIRHGRTYMYFKGDPLYPFGYGLSYTTFQYSNLKSSVASLSSEGTATISVDVKNTGTREGDEVVELYVSHLPAAAGRPTQELKGFQRVSLKPGETHTVTIPLEVRVASLVERHHQEIRSRPRPAGGASRKLLHRHPPKENHHHQTVSIRVMCHDDRRMAQILILNQCGCPRSRL